MQRRVPFRRHLFEAWRQTIEVQYQGQLINSERGLQVYFCAALLRVFDAAKIKRRIFVEPRLSSGSAVEYYYPDIVICNTRYIIGLVELKYLPRGRPDYRKDVSTLEFAASNPAGLAITNDRFLGVTADNRPYPLAPDAVLCWGAVYTGKPLNVRARVSNALRVRFLQLDAVTAANKPPAVSSR